MLERVKTKTQIRKGDPLMTNDNGLVETFDTGSNRSSEQTKLDYVGFLCPAVLERFAQYMNNNRIQPDGKERSSDNWKQGISVSRYMRGKFRHFMDTWNLLEGFEPLSTTDNIEESLCAELFNTMGMLRQVLKEKGKINV